MSITGPAQVHLAPRVLESNAPSIANRQRHALTVRVTHWIAAACFFALLVTGIEIVISHPRFYWGESGNDLTTPLFQLPIPSSRQHVPTGYGYVLPDQNGWSRALHFQSAWVIVLTGFIYVMFGLFTGHLRKELLPGKGNLSWRSILNVIVHHLRFERPGASEAWSYNVLQRLTYLLVVFFLFSTGRLDGACDVAIIRIGVPGNSDLVRRPPIRPHNSSLRLLISRRVPGGSHRHGLARRLLEPCSRNGLGPSGFTFGARMKKEVSRRKFIVGGLTTAAGISGLGVAARLAQKYGLVPPDHGGLYAPGEVLTYASLRLLTRHSMAREFSRDKISQRPFADPVDKLPDEFQALQAGRFVDWRLSVDGLVERPTSFSIAQLKSYPSRSQITELACEEGWSYIAEWNGVPLSYVLHLVGTRPEAKYVVYYSFQPSWWTSIDMADAMHPQTFLTYGMNGDDLPVPSGGPLRLRLPRQLGYKSVKFITHMTVTDDLKKFGKWGLDAPDDGYAWFAGI